MAHDRQESLYRARQRELLAQADKAWQSGDKRRAESLERQASALASFYD